MASTDKAPEKLITVKLLRDYWPSEDIKEKDLVDENGRVLAPAEISIPRDEAKRLIDLRIAERTDPLPDA